MNLSGMLSRYMPPPPGTRFDRASIEAWPHEVQILFEERAAIMEFDGGMSREQAEERAAADVFSRLGTAIGDA